MSRRGMAAALAVALAVLAGCKEGTEITTGGLQPTAAFAPEPRPGTVTRNFVSLRAGSIDGGRIVLDVVITEVDQPMEGVALDLRYPEIFARFQGCRDGNLFATPRAPHCSEPVPGELVVSRNIVAPEPPVPVVGERVALRLEFLVFGVSQGPITVENRNLGGGSSLLDAGGVPIPVDWFGGTLRGE